MPILFSSDKRIDYIDKNYNAKKIYMYGSQNFSKIIGRIEIWIINLVIISIFEYQLN